MDERLKEYKDMIDAGLTTRAMAERLGIAQITVRYWMKKYGIKTLHGRPSKLGITFKDCSVCGKSMGVNPRNLKKCGSCMTAIRRFLTKQKAIEYLGGKCKYCGYCAHPAGLEFHHFSGKKDFTIGQVANKSWQVIVKELNKCILLCSICHKIEHSKRTNEYLAIAALNYKGKFISKFGHQDNLVKSAR